MAILNDTLRRRERIPPRGPRADMTVYDPRDPLVRAGIRSADIGTDVERAQAVRHAGEYEGSGTGRECPGLTPEVVRVVPRITPRKAAGSATE